MCITCTQYVHIPVHKLAILDKKGLRTTYFLRQKVYYQGKQKP